ncbi:MAG: tetratricopeptide repeat protein [Flavobacteriales bacterium]|nr:tetratricopeptide repeat protein [Flavobacteriales bacterium]
MRRWGTVHYLAVAGALAVVVLLFLLPRTPGTTTGPDQEAVVTDDLQRRLDEAVALVNGQEPMQGIMLLRQLAEEHPERPEVHWHLGLFSLQSGQVDKAAARFRKVVELDTAGTRPEAWSMLGQSYAMMDSILPAIDALTRYRQLTPDPEARKATDQALEELRINLDEQDHALR